MNAVRAQGLFTMKMRYLWQEDSNLRPLIPMLPLVPWQIHLMQLLNLGRKSLKMVQ